MGKIKFVARWTLVTLGVTLWLIFVPSLLNANNSLLNLVGSGITIVSLLSFYAVIRPMLNGKNKNEDA